MLRITLVLFIVGEAVAVGSFDGPCPDVKTVPNLDLARFLGKWFEAARYFNKFEDGAECATFNYSLAERGAIHININQKPLRPGVPSSINSITAPIGKSGNSKWMIKKSSLPGFNDKPHWIIATDYDNFAVVWSCTKPGQRSFRYSWILARKGYNLPDAKLEEAYNAAERNQVSRTYFVPTNLRDCP